MKLRPWMLLLAVLASARLVAAQTSSDCGIPEWPVVWTIPAPTVTPGGSNLSISRPAPLTGWGSTVVGWRPDGSCFEVQSTTIPIPTAPGTYRFRAYSWKSWASIAAVGGVTFMSGDAMYVVQPTYTALDAPFVMLYDPATMRLPVAPAAVRADQVAPGTVQLAWAPVSGAAYYLLLGAGIPRTGIQVTGTSYAVGRVPGPGMGRWMVSAYFNPGSTAIVSEAFARAADWVTASVAGFQEPSLPIPSFRAGRLSSDYGPLSDGQATAITLGIPAPKDPSACPLTPLFYYDAGQPPVPAAPAELSIPSDAPAYKRYPIAATASAGYSVIYFRAPLIRGLTFVKAPAYNTRIFVVNCLGEYSDPLPFRVEPTETTSPSQW